jgi:hypothetical protein
MQLYPSKTFRSETFGKCRLCLEPGELQRSHLLPKALYRMIGRGTDRLHPDTVQLTSGSQRKSSEQASCHLLCSACEQRLNAGGEDWMLRKCYLGQGRFELRSEVRRRAVLSGAEIEAYAASEEQIARLAYFSLSVVWRASLCDWFCRGEKYQQVDLGPYQEEIRRYLTGNAEVPHRVGVMVLLSGLERPWLAMSFPFSYRESTYHCYRFHIPGITFVATVGGRDSSVLGDRASILQSPNPVLIGTQGDRRAEDEMMLLCGRNPPRGFEAPLVEGTERT